MPYAFDETLNALGLTGQDGGQAPAPGGNAVLSDAEGDISGAGGGQGAPKPVAQAATAPTAGGKRAIMQRNEGKSQAPADLQKMNDSISGAKQSLQNEANSYVDRADDNYEMSDDQIKANVQGYAKGGMSPDKAAWLNYFNSAPEMAQPFKQETNTKVEDVDLLKNDSGIRELYRRGQDAEGTMGEAALDTALLRKNQDFNVKRDETVRSYRDLKEGEKEINSKARDEAQKRVNESAESYKNRVGKTAEGMLPGYDTSALERERQFDEALSKAEEDRRKALYDDAQAYLNRMADSGAYDDYTAKALRQAMGEGMLFNPNAIDPMQFYRAGKTANDTRADQFYTDQEASEWNNIMSLLGRGGTTRSAGQLAGMSNIGEFLGGGMDWNAFSDAALKFATPLGADTKKSAEQMAADQKARADAIAAAEARRKYEEYLAKPETREEEVARKNKNDDEYTEREKANDERELEEVEKKQKKRNMDSWLPWKW